MLKRNELLEVVDLEEVPGGNSPAGQGMILAQRMAQLAGDRASRKGIVIDQGVDK